MECRICAEDPENQFFPSPGKIVQLREPAGPHIRIDSGVYTGWTVPLEYDSLLAKLIAWGPDRPAAIERLLRALHEYSIAGVQTNLGFFRELLEDSHFREGNLHTDFIADFFGRRPTATHPSEKFEQAIALAAASHAKNRQQDIGSEKQDGSQWVAGGRSDLLR
jgi:acetyl-CoA carboxylase, biotin carboxylase subunit